MTVTKEGIFSGVKHVSPARGLVAEVVVPGDKSISHRAVILGSIAGGVTRVEGFLDGGDNISTINAFRAMGVSIERPEAGLVIIRGAGMNGLKEPEDVIDAGNSGTTARLLAGLLSGNPFFSVITGDETLRRRPMKRVVTPLSRMGAAIRGRSGDTLLPLAISGGALSGITYRTPVASAQVKSAILLAGLYADGTTTVREPEKTRDHTERMLRFFGADVEIKGNSVSVRKTRSLHGRSVTVPGDISSAAFLMVGAMITPSSELIIKNVGINPARSGIIPILRKMGGTLELKNIREASGEPVADILVKSSRLKGVDISGKELLPAIDEFPVICVAASCAEGKTAISGAGELRVKESDRIAVMASMLGSVGVRNKEKKDGIVIEGAGKKALRGGLVSSHGDHRIAMSMAIAALRSRNGIDIEGALSVDVSFPGFFRLLEEITV
ncbi:MAG: 3-phosphoshikimate 1-carboxyvinyltransferase [Deltaproteobacteria bacterium]|nr:3-phosphoshikimate 1-carboxyvinyltransferase [Deltaproteobacteria bacterium]